MGCLQVDSEDSSSVAELGAAPPLRRWTPRLVRTSGSLHGKRRRRLSHCWNPDAQTTASGRA